MSTIHPSIHLGHAQSETAFVQQYIIFLANNNNDYGKYFIYFLFDLDLETVLNNPFVWIVAVFRRPVIHLSSGIWMTL